ncbi:MAG: NAD(P)/FAD-dependent oxidoreductase [Alphaproteobacteria bacterium]|nr:NAD(P)/FAD-dependent oxidoreductase [Alphaproteobacteria bacterium]MCB9794457.1 NAD(P)/FAD-dependent oxidoreductase [Alphaproteobacteria bacterium]
MSEHVTVAIIGAGFSGIGAAILLQRAGIQDVRILERADAVGGTWRDNVYPGAACDVPSHLYSLSFAPKADWSTVYGQQEEIRRYLEAVVDQHGLRPRIRFGAEVMQARFEPTTGRWVLRCADGARVEARHLIAALGPIRDPLYPELPGLGSLDGPELHSARWDPEVALEGRVVGVVGTGASAVQIIPALAPRVRHLHVFQRTPAWIADRPDGPYSALALRLLKHVPGLRQAVRLKQYIQMEYRYPTVMGPYPVLRPVAEWMMRRRIHQHIPDPDTRAALTPSYRAGCKRVLSSSTFYPSLARENVSLHGSAVREVRPQGVITGEGEAVDLDALVWCTGFEVQRPLGRMKVSGLRGEDLEATWGARPVAYLGSTMPGFPNAYILLGPNSGLGHNSVLLMSEAQMRYAVQGILRVERTPGLDWLELEPAALEDFVAEMDRRHEGQAWRAGCRSWYLNDAGQNFAIWPGSTIDFMRRTRRFDAEQYREGRVAVLS